MIILRQKEYSALSVLGGVGGFIGGAKLGSKIKIKRKPHKFETRDEEEAVKEYKDVIKHAKSGFTKKQALTYPYWHADDLLSKYGVGDNPDELDYRRLNEHRDEIIKESEKRLKQHEEALKNPKKRESNTIPVLLGAAGGAIGGSILGDILFEKIKNRIHKK